MPKKGEQYSGYNGSFCLNIAADPEKYHPVSTNNFIVKITLPQNLINYADPKQRPVRETHDTELTLKIAADSIPEPTFTQQSIGYKKGNLGIDFPGTIDNFSGRAKFHVFVTSSAYDILYSWKMASGNHLSGDVGDPSDYWATVEIYITTGNKGTLVGTWTWHNVWCKSLSGVTFTNGSNEAKTCEIEMCYFRPEYEGSYSD